MCVEESVHIMFDETNSLREPCYDNDFEIGLTRSDQFINFDEELNPAGTNRLHIPEEEMIDPQGDQVDEGIPNGGAHEEVLHPENESTEELQAEGTTIRRFQLKPWKHQNSHPLELIISDIEMGTQTRSQLKNFCAFHVFCP